MSDLGKRKLGEMQGSDTSSSSFNVLQDQLSKPISVKATEEGRFKKVKVQEAPKPISVKATEEGRFKKN